MKLGIALKDVRADHLKTSRTQTKVINRNVVGISVFVLKNLSTIFFGKSPIFNFPQVRALLKKLIRFVVIDSVPDRVDGKTGLSVVSG